MRGSRKSGENDIKLFLTYIAYTVNAYLSIKYNEQNVSGMLQLFSQEAQITFLPLGENGIGKVSELGNSIWSQLLDCFPGMGNKLLKTKYDSEGNLIWNIH